MTRKMFYSALVAFVGTIAILLYLRDIIIKKIFSYISSEKVIFTQAGAWSEAYLYGSILLAFTLARFCYLYFDRKRKRANTKKDRNILLILGVVALCALVVSFNRTTTFSTSGIHIIKLPSYQVQHIPYSDIEKIHVTQYFYVHSSGKASISCEPRIRVMFFSLKHTFYTHTTRSQNYDLSSIIKEYDIPVEGEYIDDCTPNGYSIRQDDKTMIKNSFGLDIPR